MRLKIGDRVKLIKDVEYVESGTTGTVVHIHAVTPNIGICFDIRSPMLHSCEYHCDRGTGWYVFPDDIQLIQKAYIDATKNWR